MEQIVFVTDAPFVRAAFRSLTKMSPILRDTRHKGFKVAIVSADQAKGMNR